MGDFILGVAGHVDHGKTALTYALTGVETDRLAEEKARGLTIRADYAPLTLPDGSCVALADVPGHASFIGNMLTGAAGLDAVLLCIAADDGVMPQTIEHLDLCALLGVTRGVVAVTKSDLLQTKSFSLMHEKLQLFLANSPLAEAPILPVSAHTGQGLPQLIAALADLSATLPHPREAAPFRMAVDRVFSVAGFGTVATGAVVQGRVAVGDSMMVYPAGQLVRIRAIERHGVSTTFGMAGQRLALNLAGIDRKLLPRGSSLAAPYSLTVTDRLVVDLSLLCHAPFSVKSGSRLHLYHGGGEYLCRVGLQGVGALQPGESCTARLRLDKPLAVGIGDRFVLRFFSPVVTVGGGVVTQVGTVRSGTVPLETQQEQAPALLAAYHTRYPLRDGMPLAEFINRTGCSPQGMAGIARHGTAVALATFRPKYSVELARERDKIEVRYRRFGFEPQRNAVVDGDLDREVVSKLLRDGVLVALGGAYRIHRRYLEQARAVLAGLEEVKLGAFRDALGVSRRYAEMVLRAVQKDK